MVKFSTHQLVYHDNLNQLDNTIVYLTSILSLVFLLAKHVTLLLKSLKTKQQIHLLDNWGLNATFESMFELAGMRNLTFVSKTYM